MAPIDGPISQHISERSEIKLQSSKPFNVKLSCDIAAVVDIMICVVALTAIGWGLFHWDWAYIGKIGVIFISFRIIIDAISRL